MVEPTGKDGCGERLALARAVDIGLLGVEFVELGDDGRA